MKELTTKSQYEKLSPLAQGYVVYMESEWPGSELKGMKNPYSEGTPEHDEWNEGEFRGVLAAQDSEE